MDQPIKISLLSCRPRKWDKAYNADLLEAFVRRANRKRPDLILGPEGMLEGYVVNEVIRDPSTRDAMVEVAEPIDGPAIKRFRKLARTLKVCIAFGFAERIRREVYNPVLRGWLSTQQNHVARLPVRRQRQLRPARLQ